MAQDSPRCCLSSSASSAASPPPLPPSASSAACLSSSSYRAPCDAALLCLSATGYIRVGDYEGYDDWDEDEERQDDGKKEVKKEEVKRVASRVPGPRPRDRSAAATGTQRVSSFAVRRRRHGWKPPVEKEKGQKEKSNYREPTYGMAAAAVQSDEVKERSSYRELTHDMVAAAVHADEEKEQKERSNYREPTYGMVAAAVQADEVKERSNYRELTHDMVAAAVQADEAAVDSAPAQEPSVRSPQAKPTGPQKLTKGFTVVPMMGNAYNLGFVEERGKQTGYMSNAGPVKVRLPHCRPASAFLSPSRVCISPLPLFTPLHPPPPPPLPL